MAKQTMILDPNAQAYTDNEIVTKINNASNTVTRSNFTDLDKIQDGTANKHLTSTEKTKLGTVEDGATADQTGAELRDAIVALSDADRKIVITEPISGQFKVIGLQRTTDGKLQTSYDDTPI